MHATLYQYVCMSIHSRCVTLNNPHCTIVENKLKFAALHSPSLVMITSPNEKFSSGSKN